MAFIPEGYEIPKSSDNYLKFTEPKTKFRILSSPVMGFEYWTKPAEGEKKGNPVRSFDRFDSIPKDAQLDDKGRFNQKYFWALKVFNYNDGKIKVLQITQKTILDAILAYVHNEDYGDPREYDITVSRIGEQLETRYTTIASPPKTASNEVIDADMATPVNLKALLTGENPFDVQLEEIDLDFRGMIDSEGKAQDL
jgi:hypothetical protein